MRRHEVFVLNNNNLTPNRSACMCICKCTFAAFIKCDGLNSCVDTILYLFRTQTIWLHHEYMMRLRPLPYPLLGI